jgi:pre-mRNA-splicing factor RBM22/SLT11
LNIKGHDLKITWGRPRPTGPKTEVQAATTQNVVLPPLESMQIPAPPGEASPDFLYPSQGKRKKKLNLFYLYSS